MNYAVYPWVGGVEAARHPEALHAAAGQVGGGELPARQDGGGSVRAHDAPPAEAQQPAAGQHPACASLPPPPPPPPRSCAHARTRTRCNGSQLCIDMSLVFKNSGCETEENSVACLPIVHICSNF